MKLRDPISGLSHLAGALLGLVGLIFLVARSAGHSIEDRVSLAVFGLTLILLYSASATYHLPHFSERALRISRRIDHSMIYFFIAGTYTPFCVVALRGHGGMWLLAAVWSLSLAGLGLKIFWLQAPRWLSTGLYLSLGWAILFAISPLYHALSESGFAWLVAGGLCYTFGAVIYGVKRPNPYPPHFGFHEIWHLFVLAGSLCHFFSVASLL